MESKCIEYFNGKKWKNFKGLLHRENDLPAYEGTDGYKAWYIDGNVHRELGPAIILPNGLEYWYLNGLQYTLKDIPIKLFLSYLNWEIKKKHGI